MSVRKEVELIIEHNITKRTRVNHFGWDPCATSTPVRKPLNTLNNFEPGFCYNQCDVVPRSINFKTIPKKLGEGQNFEVNSSKKTAKKNKTRSRNNSLGRDGDDDESDDNEGNKDCLKNNESKKNLIIKLGSSQLGSKRMKRTKSMDDVKEEASLNSNIKARNKMTKKKVVGRSASCKTRAKANNSNVKSPAFCEKGKKMESGDSSENGNTATAKDDVSNHSTANNLAKGDLVSVIPEKTEKVTEFDSVPCKRKNKTTAPSHIVSKKSKSDPKLEDCELNKNDSDPAKMESDEDILDKSVKEINTKLSNSHEIFSENKERELRDSLDMTAPAPASATVEFNDNPESGHTKVISIFQKKQRVMVKKKISDSKKKLKSKTLPPSKMGGSVGRPRKVRKSPKGFSSPKSEDGKISKDSAQEVGHTGNQEKVKEAVPPSPTRAEMTETSNKKIMASNENGSSSSFTNKDFFNDVKEMEFIEIPSNGNEKEVYSFALGWKFRAFKCGALRISKNCESSGRTEHENSHFGGVLLQGKLLMKIEDTEMELGSGQMFCVPPLTDWKATNKTGKDCILYYWCGRF